MPNELSIDILKSLSIQERKKLILEQAALIDASHIKQENLHNSYQLGQIIYSLAKAYFQYQIEQDNQSYSVLKIENQSELIYNITNQFAESFVIWLAEDFKKKKAISGKHPNPCNLFELCDAKLLITSNSITRTLSTKMGQLWEKIANISPYVIIPEVEFGIKITGIDIVILSENKVHFAQLKTLKGTLTGSQVPRSKNELSIHQNPLFIVAFNLGSWTFNDSVIPRIAGKEFWTKISIDYDIIETHVRCMLQKIDKAFAKLADN